MKHKLDKLTKKHKDWVWALLSSMSGEEGLEGDQKILYSVQHRLDQIRKGEVK